jgi:hypothetical protein
MVHREHRRNVMKQSEASGTLRPRIVESDTMHTATRHGHCERPIAKARESEPVAAAVVHPCDEASRRGAVEAAPRGSVTQIRRV